VQFMQSRRVLEQRLRAVERTALVDRAHQRGEDSILSTMPITMPSHPVPWQADLVGATVRVSGHACHRAEYTPAAVTSAERMGPDDDRLFPCATDRPRRLGKSHDQRGDRSPAALPVD
jgi:hypothetical protein